MGVDLADFTEPHAERQPAAVAVDWAAVEEWLGVRLPGDYKRLAGRYGPLGFGEYIWIHVPCGRPGRFDFGTWLRQTHREAWIAARELPEGERYAVHPEPGGLLAWAYDLTLTEYPRHTVRDGWETLFPPGPLLAPAGARPDRHPGGLAARHARRPGSGRAGRGRRPDRVRGVRGLGRAFPLVRVRRTG